MLFALITIQLCKALKEWKDLKSDVCSCTAKKHLMVCIASGLSGSQATSSMKGMIDRPWGQVPELDKENKTWNVHIAPIRLLEVVVLKIARLCGGDEGGMLSLQPYDWRYVTQAKTFWNAMPLIIIQVTWETLSSALRPPWIWANSIIIPSCKKKKLVEDGVEGGLMWSRDLEHVTLIFKTLLLR